MQRETLTLIRHVPLLLLLLLEQWALPQLLWLLLVRALKALLVPHCCCVSW